MVDKQGKGKISALFISIFALIIALSTLGAMVITVIAPTENPLVTSDNTVNLSYGIDASDGLSSITHSWNGTNTTLYDSSLVLFMNFDNRSALGENDTIVKDLSMYGNNGTVVGGENITWGSTYGKYGGAFNFSGDFAYIPIALNDEIDKSSEFTISAFFNTNTIVGSGDIVAKTGSGGNQRVFEFARSTNDFKFIIYHNGWDTNFTSNIYSDFVSINTWYNLIATYNYPGNISLYLNGVLVDTDLLTYPIFDGSTNSVIGRNDYQTNYFNGSIDDLIVLNRSLSASEVNYLYRTQVTKYNESYLEYNVTNNDNSALGISSFLCVTNSIESEFCTENQIIKELDEVKVNFSNSIDIINNVFYGSGSGGSIYNLGTVTMVDTNGDSVLDATTNYALEREAIFNANVDFWRLDAELSNIAYENHTFKSQPSTNHDINVHKEVIKLAHDNGKKVLIVMSYMPTWLNPNYNTSWCEPTMTRLCPPDEANLTRWGELNTDYLDAIDCDLYPETCYVEVWNEPEYTFFMNKLGTDATNMSLRSIEYNKMYNQSYFSIKALYPSIAVGGPAMVITSATKLTMLDNFLSNFSDEMDFISWHVRTNITDNIDEIVNLHCSNYSANCSQIFITEYGMPNAPTKFYDNPEMYFSNNFIDVLNNYPSNVSLIVFKWSTSFSNLGYNEGHQVMFEQFTPSYNMSYNVTSAFAHLCPAGATVYVTSGDDSDIKQVSCKKGNQYSLIVINTGLESKNVTLNMSMTNGTVVYPYANLVNYEDDTTTYKVSSDGISQLGVMDSYEILYLYSGVEDGALLRGVFKLNEGSGNTIYDSLQNLSNGVKSGATWVTDGILNTLTSGVDYTISTSGLFVVSSSYLFNYMNSSWSYLATWRDTGSTASLVMVDSLGNSTTFLSLLIVISFAVVILTLFKPSVNTNPLGKPHY